MDLHGNQPGFGSKPQLFCGRCTGQVAAHQRYCPECDFDFNGSGRFSRFPAAPSTLSVWTVLADQDAPQTH